MPQAVKSRTTPTSSIAAPPLAQAVSPVDVPLGSPALKPGKYTKGENVMCWKAGKPSAGLSKQ